MYSVYAKLRDLKGLSDYAVAKEIGIGRSTLSDWKTGKHIPNRDNLRKIADFFDVSLEYLMTGKIPSIKDFQPSPEQQNAIYWYKLYSMASPEVQKAIDLLLKPSE